MRVKHYVNYLVPVRVWSQVNELLFPKCDLTIKHIRPLIGCSSSARNHTDK